MMEKKDWIRYILVFFITLTLFLSSAGLSSFMGSKKVGQIKNMQDKIAIDIMSSETQFQLLQEFTCKDVSASTLSSELNSLAEKISYSEQNMKKKEDVKELKKYYSLLQIKDYLLMQKIKEKCNVPIVPIFYFYTTSENCSNCVKEAAVLNKLRTDYPEVRVYSFDYNLDLSALKTLLKTFKVEDTKLPALYMNDKLYTGFLDEKEILEILPELEEYKTLRLEKEKEATSSTTATTATSGATNKK